LVKPWKEEENEKSWKKRIKAIDESEETNVRIGLQSPDAVNNVFYFFLFSFFGDK